MRLRYGLPSQRLPRHSRLLAAIALLQQVGADKQPHSLGRSLLGHLVGTAQLLIAWNAPIATVLAGLTHSIYGTNAFRKVSLAHNERQRLQQTIGRRAEHLVWLFANLRRPHTLQRAAQRGRTLVRLRKGRTRHLDRDDIRQLFILECANLMDQGISLSGNRKLLPQAQRHAFITPEMRRSLRCQLSGHG
jgi:hypothetical protein